jgi:hypothetical protein
MVQVNAKIEINLMLEPSIVKIQHQLVVAMGFEGGLLVRLEAEKHMIIFLEDPFGMLLVTLLLHMVLGHVEVILQIREGSCSTL